jgi:hypothetical protein
MRSLAIVAALLYPAAALANGRPPLTNGVHFRPGDNHSLYVATTFGLLVSHDDGCSFRWICEQNIGYGGTFDPKSPTPGSTRSTSDRPARSGSPPPTAASRTTCIARPTTG